MRLVINMPVDLAAKVKDYRFDHRIDTQAEAIRLLIEKGLKAEAGGPTPKKGGRQ